MKAPTDVTATSCSADSNCLLVSWKSLPASYVEHLRGVFQGYTVLYRAEGEPYEDLFVSQQEKERHEAQLLNLTGYTNYTVQVLVVTMFGVGVPSPAQTALTGESAPGVPPDNLTPLTINSSSIEVSWTPIPSKFINAAKLLGYQVFWCKANDSVFNVTTTELPSVLLTDLEEYTDYNVIVNAFNYIGNGPNSSLFTAKTEEEALKDAPQNVSGFNTSSSTIYLSWLHIPHDPRVHHYRVIYTEHDPPSGVTFYVDTSRLQRESGWLKIYTKYEFTVCGVNSQGEGPQSLPVIISTDMDVPSASPTQLVASRINSSNHVKLSWLPVSSSHINAPVLLGYIVNYKETGELTFLTNKTENTWIELYLPNNNTEYQFTVSGYNERGVGPNISLAYIFPSLNASSTGNNSLGAHGSNATNNTSGSSNTTLSGKLKGNCHT
ncbi:hypothetical protein OS493_008909 [Desmophyllum pertusum]|uniref:Fibronectin type-III domain-containing protein n=1 Tax=Desmophyllum pertusum TaxID=174260 RepID=A0A9W9ZFA0_9CNID|nr:hypothetical protein OS493_008909 [Desmophyllum pertusum]